MPDEEGYITVDPRVLAALKELFWFDLTDKGYKPVIRLLLQVVRIDPTSGTVILNAQLVRDLDDDKPERGFGSI